MPTVAEMIAAVMMIAATYSAAPLTTEPLPVAYIEAQQATPILPEIDYGNDVAFGVMARWELLPGQQAEVFAVVGDGPNTWVMVGQGWIYCQGDTVVRSASDGKRLGIC